jgi:hypothetical protein
VGLDAVVYRNIENLPEPLKAQVKLIDPQTGETRVRKWPDAQLTHRGPHCGGC